MMKSAFLLIMCLLSGSREIWAQSAAGPDGNNYQEPYFADKKRIEKIQALLPTVEKMYRDYATQNKFPGLSFAVVTDNQLYAGNYGFTDLTKQISTGKKSLFRIASMTKSFTCLAILKLRDEGKLMLDDPAAKYLPALAASELLTKDAPAITLRHLMTHSAGFPEDNPWGDRQLDISGEAFITMLDHTISFSNVPGTTYEYSNMGFAMLGAIITQVSGQSYQQYITEKILEPLGMTHTLWEYTAAPAILLAHGYRYEQEQWKEEALLHDGAYGAMGGLITSVEDFGKYMSFFLSAWPANNRPDTGPVKRSSLRELQQAWIPNNLAPDFRYPGGRVCPMMNSYGYGLRISQDCENRKYVGHTGGLPGFGSQWWVMPDYGIGVVALGNLTYASMGNINWAVLDTLIRGAGLKPREIPASPVLVQRQKQLEKIFPNWENATQLKIFAINFFADKSLEIRKQKTDALFRLAGEIKRVGVLQAQNQLRGTFVLYCEKAAIEVYFTLSPENPALIQYLDFSLLK